MLTDQTLQNSNRVEGATLGSSILNRVSTQGMKHFYSFARSPADGTQEHKVRHNGEWMGNGKMFTV